MPSRKNPVDELLLKASNLPAVVQIVVSASAAGFSFVSVYVNKAPVVGILSAIIALSFAFLTVTTILREVRWLKHLEANASPEILSSMNRKDFELFLTILFRLSAYKIRSAINECHRQDDADWILTRKKETVLLQFNHFDEETVGIQPLQSLQKAAMLLPATSAISITTGQFQPEAIKWANRKGLRLMMSEDLVAMAEELFDKPSTTTGEHNAVEHHQKPGHLQHGKTEYILFVDFSGVSSGLNALQQLITRTYPFTLLVATTLPEEKNTDALSSDTGMKIIGETKHHPSGRYFAIQRFLAQFPSGKKTPWVALDTEPQQFPPGCSELVVVNPTFGLNPAAITRLQQAISLTLAHQA